jgi:hypothetical protein
VPGNPGRDGTPGSPGTSGAKGEPGEKGNDYSTLALGSQIGNNAFGGRMMVKTLV